MTNTIPENLILLHQGEEQLRLKALGQLDGDSISSTHLIMIERTMDLADMLRQFDTADEDLKLIQVLGIRCFNAFASALKLALSGYAQNSALIMRDVLETVFLLDLFRGERSLIGQWRTADKQVRKKVFSPIQVRMKLDNRDGVTSMKRAAAYDMFSELAAHPTMQSVAMLRPLNMDARIGPFIDNTVITAVIAEMGKLAVQVGEQLYEFIPRDWTKGLLTRAAFLDAKKQWIETFYPAP
jgi:hypothetical protein